MNRIILNIQIIFVTGLSMWFCMNTHAANVDLRMERETKVVFDLKEIAVVNGGYIKASDVANVESRDLDLSLLIDNLIICSSPWPGNHRIIKRGEINSLLFNNGIDVRKINFIGADEVKVSVRSIVISGNEIAKYAESYLQNKLNEDENGHVITKLQRNPGDHLVPIGNGEIKLKFSRVMMGRSRKKAQLSADIMVDGSVYKSVGMVFDVSIFKDVVVAKTQVKKGDIVSRNSVKLETIESTTLKETSFGNVEDVIGKVARRSIAKGFVFNEKSIKGIDAIRKGDSVIILIGTSGFEIASKGICQDNGGFGDFVRVVNVDTKKMLHGSVIDGGTVRVQF